MNYTIRKIRKEDDAVIENIIRTCLIEFGAAREGTASRRSRIWAGFRRFTIPKAIGTGWRRMNGEKWSEASASAL